MDLGKLSIQGLPSVDFDGTTLYIRELTSQELPDVIDDCMQHARNVTSKDLKGETPNPIKRAIVEKMLAENPDLGNLMIGKVNLDDAYDVAIAHATAFRFVGFGTARALVSEDGTDAFPDFETRERFAVATTKRDDLLAKVLEAKEKLDNQGSIPNDSPADLQE